MEDLQVKVVTKPLEGEQSTNVCCSFDDDFTTDQVLPVAVKYQPLHDSVEYLAKLEKSLAKVQKKPIHSSLAEKRDLLLSLSGAKEGHIKRLLNLPESGNLSPQDTPIPLESLTGSLIRHLAPHRQAVSASELVELLSADHLNQLNIFDQKQDSGNFTESQENIS